MSLNLCQSSRGEHISRARRNQPLFPVVVHCLDQLPEALIHQFSFDLARRRYWLAFFFRIERLGQDTERFDLLDAGKVAIDLIKLDLDQLCDAGCVVRLVKPV